MCITYVRNRQTRRSAGKLYLVKECCHSSRTICGQPERALYVYVTIIWILYIIKVLKMPILSFSGEGVDVKIAGTYTPPPLRKILYTRSCIYRESS